jgi:hypothetical protein
MSERKQSPFDSVTLNRLEYYAKEALTPPRPEQRPFKAKRYRRPAYEVTNEEKLKSAEIRRDLELPGRKIFTIEDKEILSQKSNNLRPAYSAIVDVLVKVTDVELKDIFIRNIDILLDSAMWIGAYVFVTDGSQESIENYARHKQTEVARRNVTERFVDIINAVEAVAAGRELLDSDRFAAEIQNAVAERMGLSKYKAPSFSAIRRAVRELKKCNENPT